jgi:hypothetical protein
MARGVYKCNIKIAGLNTARTLMYITTPATCAVEIISATVGNESNSTNQQSSVKLTRVTTLGTPSATTVTPSPTDVGDVAAASTVKGNVTASEPTYGTVDFGLQGFATLSGWGYFPGPDERITIPPSATMGLRFVTTPTAFDADIEITMREIG